MRIAKETRLVYGLICLVMLLGITYMLINRFSTHYSGFDYVPERWLILAPFIFALSLFSLYAAQTSPKLAFFTHSYTTFFFIALAFSIMTTGIQYTPFPTIDSILAKADVGMGFNTPALIAWTADHPIIHKIFSNAYDFLYIEIIAVPLILPLFKKPAWLYHFFITMLIAFILGSTIYNFFPTTAPASIFHSAYFTPREHDTLLKFYEVHHHETVTTGKGGLIAFPSFHVAWAVIFTYALKNKKWLLIPTIFINFILILSTLFLGWHYLLDVFAGIFIGILSILLARYATKTSSSYWFH